MWLGRLRRLSRGSWPTTSLGDVMQRNIPRAFSRRAINEVLERMTDQSRQVIPLKVHWWRVLGVDRGPVPNRHPLDCPS